MNFTDKLLVSLLTKYKAESGIPIELEIRFRSIKLDIFADILKIDLLKQRAALSYIPGTKDNVYASRSVSIFPKAVWYLGIGGVCDTSLANGPTWSVNVNGTIYKYNIPPYYIDYYIYKYVSTEIYNYIYALPKDIKYIIQQYFVAPRQLGSYNLYI